MSLLGVKDLEELWEREASKVKLGGRVLRGGGMRQVSDLDNSTNSFM